MAGRIALVTGAGGEMGHLLLPELTRAGYDLVTLDLNPLDEGLRPLCAEAVTGSVADSALLTRLFREHPPEVVFHLAALLSSKSERDPDLAHEINVGATLDLFRLGRERARQSGVDVRFLFPSSIAVYGLPDAAAKARAGAVAEDQWNQPAGMYGCNKLYDEMVGSYFTARARKDGTPGLDFRAIRFPGLISAETLPSGGTSDYAPEMIHAAAQGHPYACFVSADTRMPFMTMPDAVGALLRLDAAPAAKLTTRVYNIGAFSPSAAEIRDAVLTHYPDAEIVFEPVAWRQAIVDTWPESVDDSRARRDWGHAPKYRLAEAVKNYLVPALQARYGVRVGRL
ncbi:MAG TPA: NAD-dependent epimerase/dehydratase family protein [Candidatus Polarisedimenticolaceae bacterium]|nr:NAD-dependent epimerase/dehydratase family protein [Candidatus Polarisedimenticolaceae bacterium]